MTEENAAPEGADIDAEPELIPNLPPKAAPVEAKMSREAALTGLRAMVLSGPMAAFRDKCCDALE